jgi:hypothetical protein
MEELCTPHKLTATATSLSARVTLNAQATAYFSLVHTVNAYVKKPCGQVIFKQTNMTYQR